MKLKNFLKSKRVRNSRAVVLRVFTETHKGAKYFSAKKPDLSKPINSPVDQIDQT